MVPPPSSRGARRGRRCLTARRIERFEEAASRWQRPQTWTIRDSEFTGTIGVARADISPPAGIFARSWGSSKHDIATGIHKPLLATCIAFADATGGNPLALLALDLSWWSSKGDEVDLRTAILAATGLAGAAAHVPSLAYAQRTAHRAGVLGPPRRAPDCTVSRSADRDLRATGHQGACRSGARDTDLARRALCTGLQPRAAVARRRPAAVRHQSRGAGRRYAARGPRRRRAMAPCGPRWSITPAIRSRWAGAIR